MDDITNSHNDPHPVTHAAGARPTSWDDDPLLDHHIEELLGALSDLARRGLDAHSETY
jgi:hypothetical protein